MFTIKNHSSAILVWNDLKQSPTHNPTLHKLSGHHVLTLELQILHTLRFWSGKDKTFIYKKTTKNHCKQIIFLFRLIQLFFSLKLYGKMYKFISTFTVKFYFIFYNHLTKSFVTLFFRYLCQSHNFINRKKNAPVLCLLQVKKALNKKNGHWRLLFRSCIHLCRFCHQLVSGVRLPCILCFIRTKDLE